MTSFARLVREHDAIAHRADLLIALAGDRPAVAVAAEELRELGSMVHEHLEQEDAAIFASVDAVAHSRHDTAVMAAAESFEALKRDWLTYIARWSELRIAADWAGFGAATRAMLPRLRARLDWETAVLYSLAVHHAVIAADPATSGSEFPAPSRPASTDRTA